MIKSVSRGKSNKELDKYLHIDMTNQFGFILGFSTETAVLCLKQTGKYYTDKNTPGFDCFLDLTKAFDLVCYDILWKKM